MLDTDQLRTAMPSEKRLLRKLAVHNGDLPERIFEDAVRVGTVAWDIETSGLGWAQHRVCTCQLFIPDTSLHVVRINDAPPKRLISILESEHVTKIFHHAMFDLRFMAHHWSVSPRNLVCTKIASKILSPAEQDHSLKHLLKAYLDIMVDKSLQTSNWEAKSLKRAQLRYAAKDVLYLPGLLARLRLELEEKQLWPLAQASFEYLPTRVQLDLLGSEDVFRY